MKRLTVTLCTTFALVAIFGRGEAKQDEKAAIDKPAPQFTLKDYTGKEYSLADFKGRYVVLEWTNMDCPFVHKHYSTVEGLDPANAPPER